MSRRTQGLDLLATARDLGAIMAVFLFFVGFVFHYYYLSFMGMRHDSDQPVYIFFVNAWTAISTDWLQFGCIAAAAIVLSVLPSLLRDNVAFIDHHWDPLRVTMWLIFVAASFPFMYSFSEDAAKRVAYDFRENGGNSGTIFEFTTHVYHVYGDLRAHNTNGELRLLGQTKDTYYVFYQPYLGESPPQPGNVYAIDRSDVKSYHTIVP